MYRLRQRIFTKYRNIGGNNMIAFINSVLSYLLLMVIIVALCLLGGFIGLKLRKNKDAKDAIIESEAKKEE